MISIVAISETISHSYRVSSPEIINNNGYSYITFKDAMLTGLEGEPSIPYFAVTLLLPPGEVATSVKYIGEYPVKIDGSYIIKPYQPSIPLSETAKQEFKFNEDIYRLDSDYPKDKTGRFSTSYLHGHSIVMTTFTPLIYTPLEGSVSYYTSVRIEIETSPDPKAQKAMMNLTASTENQNVIQGFVQNPKELEAYNSYRIRSDSTYKLLIITTDYYSGSFEDLRGIYLDRGLKSEVATTEDISTAVSGQDLQEKIRNYIIQEYQDKEIEYVLLGGDIELIPHRGFYCYVQSGSGYTDSDIPADLYYSALDGNWNNDGDDKWGEPEEDDLLPEVAVARYSFSTEAELDKMIHKSIYYQNYPVLGELTKPLFAGENLYSGPDTWGRDYLDLLIGERSDNGYTTFGIPETYPIDSIYEFHAPWYGSTLMAHVNQGKQFVHHVGHANATYVAHMNNSDITNSNFSGANGIDHNYTIMQTHGCICGAFDVSDCILEEMVKIDNFAVSVIGNSRYGWFNEGQTEGPAAHLHREMVDALYHEQMNHLGKAFVESKIQTAPWVEAPGQWEEGALRWNFYDINILGDPALSVWTNEPIYLTVVYEEDLEIGTTSTDVSVSSGGSPMENFTCSVLKEGVLYATGVTDANGEVTLVFDPVVTESGEANLIVVGYNSLPDTSIINFIPSGEAYVVYNQHVVDDNTGNNNGIADYGESILLDLEVVNMGALDANNVVATLTTNDTYISLTDDSEDYGTVAVDDSIMIQSAFAFDVSGQIPDQRVVEFELMCEGDSQTWYSDFTIIMSAPAPEILDMVIDDTNGGNGNNRFDPDETALVSVVVKNNGHSDCASTLVELSTSNPYVVIDPESVVLGTMTAGESLMAEFTVSIDASAPLGNPIIFDCQADMCGYIEATQLYNVVGLLIEDFETGDFTSFPWQNSGNQSWVIDETFPYNGDFCSRSGNIIDDQTTEIYITVDAPTDDVITFSRKVSSESGYDFLRFYVDGDKYSEWSGEMDWEVISYEITAGQHTFMWSYEKDINHSEGSDCGWLDDIILPPAAIIIGVNEVVNNGDIIIYPNPGSGLISLKTNMSLANAEVNVFNTLGSLILVKKMELLKGKEVLDMSNFEPGLYTIRVDSDNGQIIRKLIIQ